MLVDYHQRVKAQFDVLVQEVRTQREKFDTIVIGVKPLLGQRTSIGPRWNA